MQSDSESSLLRGLAETKKEITKLRSQSRKLSKRIDQIELQGVQAQLSSISDKLLETQRTLARFQIIWASNVIIEAAVEQKPETSDHFIAQQRAYTGSATAKVNTSKEPDAVVEKYLRQACEDAEKLGIKFLLF